MPAALVSNFISPDDAWAWPCGRPDGIANDEDMVVVQMNATDGLVQAIRDDGGPATITMKPTEPAVGYLRIFDESMATDGDGDGVPEFGRWERSPVSITWLATRVRHAEASGRFTTSRCWAIAPTRRGTAMASSRST